MSPLEIFGRARLVHINARKEGPEDGKVLASDLKFTLTASNEILIAFHSQLRVMLYTKEGEPRFPLMGEIDWDYEFRLMRLHIDPETLDPELDFCGVTLKKWSFTPLKAGKVEISFQAQVHPDRQQFGILGRALIADEVHIKVHSENADLFSGEPTKGQEAARAAAATRTEEPQLPLDAPQDHTHADLKECPTCGSPNPAVHPAVQHEGEVQLCRDSWHKPTADEIEAREREEKAAEPPAPLELNDGMRDYFRSAGAAEAKKEDDDRDFDAGFATACKNADLPKDFVEEHRGELETSFTDGYDEEMNKAEGETNG